MWGRNDRKNHKKINPNVSMTEKSSLVRKKEADFFH